MNDIAIKVNNLSKVYKLYDNHQDRFKETFHPFRKKYHHDFYALKDVSFEVKKGETVGIIGKNGSGKSTLLQILTGVLSPSGGTVEVNGKVSALLELGAGFNPEFTGIENIYFNGSIMGYSKEEMDEKLDEILAFADIGEFVHQPVKIYSSGMFARLAFALAINVDPDILIVDEALSVGDALFQRKCFAKIRNFLDEGKTVFFVSHSSATIVDLCTQAKLFDAGELILSGKPKLVVNQYNKLIFSRDEDYFELRNKIINLNEDSISKVKLEENLDIGNSNLKNMGDNDRLKENDKNKQQAFYVPSLQSQSKIEYENLGVDIYDAKITTLDNKKVNMLVTDEEYIYSYKAKFKIDAQKINFGMMFKTITGIELSGSCYPGLNETIDCITKNEEFYLEWIFRCSFLPGTYYTNAGILGLVGSEEKYLNRVIDAVAFQVQDIMKKQYSGGIINFNQKPRIKKIS